MKKVLFIILVVVLVLAMAIPVFANHDGPGGPPDTPNGPPECRGRDMRPGVGVSANIANMRGPEGENNGRGHFEWIVDDVDVYDGDPGAANITCWFIEP